MIIAAAERGGVYIPRFCYHPRMKPVGMCRMCLVEVNGPRGLRRSCPPASSPVADGQEVVTDSPRGQEGPGRRARVPAHQPPARLPGVRQGRRVPAAGPDASPSAPARRRFVEEKRHCEKPIPLSTARAARPRALHPVRPLHPLRRRGRRRPADRLHRPGRRAPRSTPSPTSPFASYFSGNTVQICPVGALTATPYRFKARPWDLEQVECTCTACAVGCRMAVQSSANRLIRYLGIDSDPVNHGWLCDKGRFGYEAVNSDERADAPRWCARAASWSRRRGARRSTRPPTAIARRARPLRARRRRRARRRPPGQRGRLRLGQAGQGRARHRQRRLPAGRRPAGRAGARPAPGHDRRGVPRRRPSSCSAPDLKEELPVLYLRLREAAVDDGAAARSSSRRTRTGLSRARRGHARATGRARPPPWPARWSTAATGDVGAASPRRHRARPRALLGAARRRHRRSAARRWPSRPTASPTPPACSPPACPSAAVPARAAAGQRARRPRHGPGARRAARPGRARRRPRTGSPRRGASVPEERGARRRRHPRAPRPTAASRRWCCSAPTRWPTSPTASWPAGRWPAPASSSPSTCSPTTSARQADVVLPAAGFAERPGTTTNIEGRVTRLGQKVTPPGSAWPDWMIAVELAAPAGRRPRLRDRSTTSPTRSSGWPRRTAGITRAVLGARRLPRRRRRAAAGSADATPGRRRRRRHRRVGEADARRSRGHDPACREAEDQGVPALASAPSAGRRRRRRRRRRRAARRCSRFAPDGAEPVASRRSTPTRCAWCRADRSTTRGTLVQHSPVAGAAGAGARACGSTPTTSTASASRPAARCASVGRAPHRSSTVGGRRRACPRGSAVARRSTRPAVGAADLIDATPAGHRHPDGDRP